MMLKWRERSLPENVLSSAIDTRSATFDREGERETADG
jgi:hypothetical protein